MLMKCARVCRLEDHDVHALQISKGLLDSIANSVHRVDLGDDVGVCFTSE